MSSMYHGVHGAHHGEYPRDTPKGCVATTRGARPFLFYVVDEGRHGAVTRGIPKGSKGAIPGELAN